MRNHSISVVIPSYNRANQLTQALQSVHVQSHPADEIIVIDDGSVDSTETVVRQQYPHVIYIKQANRGVSAARNHGIQMARCQWIALLDSDDTWHPQKLEMQIKHLQKNPGYRLCHTDEIWIRHGKRVNPMNKHRKYGGHIFRYCLPRCVISPSSVLIHRRVFDEYGLFDEGLSVCEDYDLWLRLCAFMPALFLPQALVTKYGGHGDQLSHQYWGMDRFRIQSLSKLLGSGSLDTKQQKQAKAILVEKCKIYIQGARKRHKHDEIRHYTTLMKEISHSPQDGAVISDLETCLET